MEKCADGARSMVADSALFLIEKHRGQPGARGVQIAGKNSRVAGWLTICVKISKLAIHSGR